MSRLLKRWGLLVVLLHFGFNSLFIELGAGSCWSERAAVCCSGRETGDNG